MSIKSSLTSTAALATISSQEEVRLNMENDVITIERQIREHKEAIEGFRDRLESLMRAKLDTLIKSSRDGRVEIYPDTFFCYHKGRLCMLSRWGKYSTVRSLIRTLENEVPEGVYYKIREVDLNAKNL